MGLVLALLLLALLFGGLGFAVHVLWFVALVLLVCFAVGMLAGGGRRWSRR